MSDETTSTQPMEEEPGSDVARWASEFAAARKDQQKFKDDGEKVVSRFLSKKNGQTRHDKRWELFTSNIQTQQALLYGQTPKSSVTRRFNDSADDVARVAGEILERSLNGDIESSEDGFALGLHYALEDRLLPGLGFCRIRYEVETETTPETPAILGEDGAELAPVVPAAEKKVRESVETDYVHWRDLLWSPCRNFLELRWVAFRAEMSRSQLVKRFGAKGKLVPLNSRRERVSDTTDAHRADPLARADVWEIWDKEERCVRWLVEGQREFLEEKEDPLELKGFWPFPRPMMANPTTSAFVPTCDFKFAQDLYNEIDDLTSRIALLQKAIRAAGVYDKKSTELPRLLSETSSMENKLIPVDGWAAFAERGGIKGSIEWLPLEQIMVAIEGLRQLRSEDIQVLAMVTGMADIMRGQASDERDVTAREQGIKARFGSVRMQSLQDDFARFASDLQRLKAEVMCRFFDAETFFEKSNILETPDAQLAQQAVELLKSKVGLYRIEVKPEAVSMADLSKEQSEGSEFITGVSQFLTAAAPLMQTPAAPAVLELLKLFAARFKFANEAEGILDKAMAAAAAAQTQPGAPAAPDPKVVAAQTKVQGDLAVVKAKHESDMAKLQAESVLEQQKQEAQLAADVKSEAFRSQLKMKELAAKPAPKPGGAT